MELSFSRAGALKPVCALMDVTFFLSQQIRHIRRSVSHLKANLHDPTNAGVLTVNKNKKKQKQGRMGAHGMQRGALVGAAGVRSASH